MNWLGRKDKRNTRLSAIAVVDNEHGYCFGAYLNFDPSLDRKTIQAEVDKSGDLSKPYPHRRFARLWIDADHEKASAKRLLFLPQMLAGQCPEVAFLPRSRPRSQGGVPRRIPP